MPKITVTAKENGFLAQTEGKLDLLITPEGFGCGQYFVTSVAC